MGSFTWSTTNTKLAACLGQLRYPIRTEVSQDERSGKVLTQFMIGHESLAEPADPKYKRRDDLLKAWKAKTLESETPLHPFLQGCRAEHNYELLLDAQKNGRRIRLAGVANSHATEYRDGEEAPEMVNAKAVFRLADLSLVAALGTLGIPCVKIEHNGVHHIYTLPVEGHLLRMPDGSLGRYNGINLGMRVEAGKTELLLEQRDPKHPLVAAYGARQMHGLLKKHLGNTGRMILLRPPGTSRKAIVSSNASGRVLDKVNEQFRI